MPKVVQKKGYYEVQNTGWDNFSQFLNFFNQAQQQALAKMKQQEQAEQQTIRDQMQLKIGLAEIGAKDPAMYNTLVQDPTIQSLLDPKRAVEARQSGMGLFERWMDSRRRAQKPDSTAGAAPSPADRAAAGPSGPVGGPSTRQNTPMPMITGDRLAAQNTGFTSQVAQNEAVTSTANLSARIAQMRQRGLSSDDIVQQLMGMTGSVPSPSDIGVASGVINPQTVATQTPGSPEWRDMQARSAYTELTKQYKVQNPDDQRRIMELAQWQFGLRADRPESLPAQYAALEFDLQQKGQKLREQQYGLDAAQYATSTRTAEFNAMSRLVEMGVPATQAPQIARAWISQGKLPEDFSAPFLAQKAEMQAQLAELRTEQLELNVKKLMAEDPEAESLLRTLQQYPQDQRGPGNPWFTKLVKKYQQRYGWEAPVAQEGLWGWVKRVSGLGRSDNSGLPPASPSTNPPSSRSTPTGPDPALMQRAESAASQAMAKFSQLGPQDQQRLRTYGVALGTARTSGDPEAIARALEDLESFLKLVGGN